MTWLYYDPLFLEHDTGRHPESALRLSRIVAHLSQTGLEGLCSRPAFDPVSLEQLARVHSVEYVHEVRDFAARQGGYIESDTVVSRRSFDAACKAAGAVCDAVRRVVSGEDRRAVCLVRPPGHHALRSHAMGFCLFNNVAIGARLATAELELDRVLIVDWDVHHGNGTQNAFWTDEQVGFLSIHRWPFYPGTGRADETGGGKGLGTTCNVPVPYGISAEEYQGKFAAALQPFADRIRPQLVIVSAGYDSHHEDPIGSLGLEVEDFAILTQRVVEVAEVHCGGRVVSVLEGGYNVEVVPQCVEAHLRAMMQGCGAGDSGPQRRPG